MCTGLAMHLCEAHLETEIKNVLTNIFKCVKITFPFNSDNDHSFVCRLYLQVNLV